MWSMCIIKTISLETILLRCGTLSSLLFLYMQCSKIRRRDGAVCSTLTAERSLEAALRNLKMCLAIPLPSMTGKHFSWPILALHFSRSLFSICLIVFVRHRRKALSFTNWALDVLIAPYHHVSSRCLDFVHIVVGGWCVSKLHLLGLFCRVVISALDRWMHVW